MAEEKVPNHLRDVRYYAKHHDLRREIADKGAECIALVIDNNRDEPLFLGATEATLREVVQMWADQRNKHYGGKPSLGGVLSLQGFHQFLMVQDRFREVDPKTHFVCAVMGGGAFDVDILQR